MTNAVLRRAAAHVLVADVENPVLDAATLHHLRRVLRLREGETVALTDGAGAWVAGRFASGRDEIVPVGEVVREAEAEPAVTVAVAPPKGDRADWLVQKCTEAGVDRIVWLAADRSVVQWDVERTERHLARFRRIAAEAAMQSRRVWLPVIEGPVAAIDVLARAAVAEHGGRPVRAGDTFIAIGPEGGWSPAELAMAGDTVSLGPNVLRVETAALVAVALMVDRR